MTVDLFQGDCREVLRSLPEGIVHTCVTSPPYFNLRDYDSGPNEIGQERTAAEFIAELVKVFREVRRVLRRDGTLWLNLGDSYAGSWGRQQKAETTSGKLADYQRAAGGTVTSNAGSIRDPGIKPKDLYGIPWRVALALQADGWWLRQDIIWSKPDPMPESVGDRCTKSHEYMFLLSKSADYYFDAEAIAEPAVYGPDSGREDVRKGGFSSKYAGQTGARRGDEAFRAIRETRNKRSVWTVTTARFADAHFATYPPELIEPCILAGSPRNGLVLDPFMGAGTTALVAERLGRHAIGIELNPANVEMARRRVEDEAPVLTTVSVR